MSVVAVVHPTTLAGKELRERLEARPDLAQEIRLLSIDEDEIGAVTENMGAAAFVGRLDETTAEGVDLVFLCGEIDADRRALALFPAGTRAVFLSRGVSASDAPSAVAGVTVAPLADVVASPHPAVIGLALLLAPLRELGLKGAHATVILPVSVAADAAIDELFAEARALLTFAPHEKNRFGGQLAFNLLPSRIAPKELGASLRQALTLPAEVGVSAQAVQAGIFHGIGLSVYVELSENVTSDGLRRRLGDAVGVEAPPPRDARTIGPVAAGGEETLLLGEVRPAGDPGAYWLWAALDNLIRGGALNALELGEILLGAPSPS